MSCTLLECGVRGAGGCGGRSGASWAKLRLGGGGGGSSFFSFAARSVMLCIMNIDQITFGRTGFKVGQLGFGAAPVGFLGTEQAKVDRLVHELLDAGANLIDTAAS